VRVGDAYGPGGRYVVLSKLGWGHFSTVWLVDDTGAAHGGARAALKIQKSAPHYTEAARDEITLLTQVRAGDPGDAKHCCRLLDAFDHAGPHGTHVCMVFEVLGDNLLSLIKAFKYRGVPLPAVRSLARQVLVGLDYLHASLSIIHTDLKPENVMLTAVVRPKSGAAGVAADVAATARAAPAARVLPDAADTAGLSRGQKKKLKAKVKKEAGSGEGDAAPAPRAARAPPADAAALAAALPAATAKIVDFGNACWTHKQFTSDIQTRQYRCPEVGRRGRGGRGWGSSPRRLFLLVHRPPRYLGPGRTTVPGALACAAHTDTPPRLCDARPRGRAHAARARRAAALLPRDAQTRLFCCVLGRDPHNPLFPPRSCSAPSTRRPPTSGRLRASSSSSPPATSSSTPAPAGTTTGMRTTSPSSQNSWAARRAACGARASGQKTFSLALASCATSSASSTGPCRTCCARNTGCPGTR